MHHRMPLALLAGALAARDAGFEQRPGDIGVVLGLTACHPGGRAADVGAIQAQADALDQFADVGLAQVIVSIGGAGLRAVCQRVDGAREYPGIDVEGARVAVQQLACVAHDPPCWCTHGLVTQVISASNPRAVFCLACPPSERPAAAAWPFAPASAAGPTC